MSEPEISRRCLSCGASVRRRALFCPECGKPLLSPAKPAVEQTDYGHGKGAQRKLHRATEAARRELEEVVLPQVQKLRQVSSVVLEEASYDPSLRFVLVAIVLFVIFLVLLVLSEMMG